MDATVLCTGNVKVKDYLDADLFLFQYTPKGTTEGISISNWFITSCTNNEVLMAVRDMLFEYWKEYDCVTIGSMRGQGTPVIGDNCVLFSGAKVIGRVTLGDYVAVGAGAVVVNNVPNGCVVGGVPAKVLSDKGKETVARYME